jgi:hypothetical protein
MNLHVNTGSTNTSTLCHVCPVESLIPTLPLKLTQVAIPKEADQLMHQCHVACINKHNQQAL